MVPRKRIDIGWNDLWFGVAASLFSSNWDEAERAIQQACKQERAIHPFLSVRSACDAYFSCRRWEPGSEIILSAITIRDMGKLAEAHGLRPIPIDIDPRTLSVSIDQLEEVRSEKTKALLFAHLFGSRVDLDEIADYCVQHNLELIEDCAQAWTGDGYWGHEKAEISLFSFGPIKTATALGGAIATFREATKRYEVAAIARTWREQSSFTYLKRLCKYGVLRAISHPIAYGILVKTLKAIGVNYDSFISNRVRGFSGSPFPDCFRWRPSVPLLKMVRHRVETYDRERIKKRTAHASAINSILGEEHVIGSDVSLHSYWVYPLQTEDPERMISLLAREGIDATRGATSLTSLRPLEPGAPFPAKALRLLDGVIYLPADPDMSTDQVSRMVTLLKTIFDSRSSE